MVKVVERDRPTEPAGGWTRTAVRDTPARSELRPGRTPAGRHRSRSADERVGERRAGRRERVGVEASRDAEDRSVDLIFFLLIGLAAGWLAGQLVKRRGSGWVEDLIVGVIGALIGGFVFGLLGVNVGGLVGRLISATVGAVILLFLLRYVRRV